LKACSKVTAVRGIKISNASTAAAKLLNLRDRLCTDVSN
jgi:hypothetical protein